MKRFFVAMLIIGMAAVAYGRAITSKGYLWGDVYNFLYDAQTSANEVKADYNLLKAKCQNHPLDYMSFDKGDHLTTQFSIGVSSYGAASYPAYIISDVMYQLSGSSTFSLATTTGLTAQVATTDCLYLVTADSSGAIYCTQGTAVTTGAGTEVWPAVPTGKCVVGGFKLAVAGTATGSFTVGTTVWDKITGVTFTAYQLYYPPSGTSAPTAVAASDLDLTSPTGP